LTQPSLYHGIVRKQTLTCTNHKSIQQIYKQVNTKKIHILHKYAKKKINILKLSSNIYIKKGRFAYLKWRILNKIWIRTRMLTNRVLWWSDLLWEVELCWDWGEREECWSSGHKLNINDGIADEIILSITLLIILSVKISRHRMICFFFNPIVIPSIIFSIYIKKIFLSTYLRMYFTLGLILLVMLSVKVLRHHTVWFFLFFIFPFQFSRYIPREFFCRYLPMDKWMENFAGKSHCNISMEKFHQYFYLYLLIF
jgi:hypothetical protein